MNHRSKALSVMEVRASLRERLSAGHIDLRRFLRSMGSLTSKIDSHSKYVLQCARNTVATTNAPTENAAIRHVLTSVSGNSNFLANGRGQRGRRGQGRGRGGIESIRQDLWQKLFKGLSATAQSYM